MGTRRERGILCVRVVAALTIGLLLLLAPGALAEPEDPAPEAKIEVVRVADGTIEKGIAKGTAPLVVTFSAKQSTDEKPGRVVLYRWDIAGVSVETPECEITRTFGEAATHTFGEAGVYEVSVVVMDNWGNESKVSNVVQVHVEPLRLQIASRHVPANPQDGDRVEFRILGLPEDEAILQSSTWAFGDGGAPVKADSKDPSIVRHNYVTHRGKTTVVATCDWLTPQGPFSMDLTMTLDVDGPLTAVLTSKLVTQLDPPLEPLVYPLGASVVLSAEGSQSPYSDKDLHYEFDIEGDSAYDVDSGTRPTTTCTFRDGKHPRAVVRVTDEHGNQGRAGIDFRLVGLIAVLEVTDRTGPVGRHVRVDGSKSMDMTGGRPSAVADATLWSHLARKDGEGHVWEVLVHAAGQFPVKLTVTGSDGTKAETTVILEGVAETRAVLKATPRGGACSKDEPLTVNLSADASTSASGDLRYEWDLDGDGTFETRDPEAVHRKLSLQEPGLHVVRLRVTNENGETDVDTVLIRTTLAPPVAQSPAVVAFLATMEEVGLTKEVVASGWWAHPSGRWSGRNWGVFLDNKIHVQLIEYDNIDKVESDVRDAGEQQAWQTFHGYKAMQYPVDQHHTMDSFKVGVGRFLLIAQCDTSYPKTGKEVAEIFYRHAVAGGFMK